MGPHTGMTWISIWLDILCAKMIMGPGQCNMEPDIVFSDGGHLGRAAASLEAAAAILFFPGVGQDKISRALIRHAMRPSIVTGKILLNRAEPYTTGLTLRFWRYIDNNVNYPVPPPRHFLLPGFKTRPVVLDQEDQWDPDESDSEYFRPVDFQPDPESSVILETPRKRARPE